MTRPQIIGSGLVWGFAGAIAMWSVAFIGHFPGLALPAIVPGLAMLLCQAVAAALTRAAAAGALASGIVAALNLLILGSLLIQPAEAGEAPSAIPGAVVYILGYAAASILLGALAGFLGGRALGPPPLVDSRLPRFAFVAAVGILPLLLVGGLVTSTQSGMAIAGWPTSDGFNMFLYPLSLMTERSDRFLEHSHRLFGSLVGLSLAALLLWTLAAEPRRSLKFAAAALFAFVCLQGWLGGQRVIQNHAAMGLIHGISGQILFAAALALAACLLPLVRDAARLERPPLRFGLALALLITLVIQLAFGAMFRHMSGHKHALYAHIVFALAPAMLAFLVGFMAGRLKTADTPAARLLGRCGKGLVHTTALQLLLGGAALWAVLVYPTQSPPATPRVLVGTLHQFNGALLLGLATLVAVLASRLRPAAPAAGAPAAA